MKYRVIRPFKYNGRDYEKGEIWEPSGGKFDEQIIELEHHVEVVDERIETRRDRRLKVKARESGEKVDTLQTVVFNMRSQEPPITYKQISEMLDISISTARRYYEREMELKNG